MSLLRLRQFADGENRYRVVAEFENGGVRRSAESRFELQLSAQDQEDIRWYLEDFLQYPMDPAPAIAAGIERRMAEIGADLFTKALGNTPVWHEVRHHLSGTRVEIETTVKDATALPWELLRDPGADVPLALRARAFVRASHDAIARPKLTQSTGGPIRVLLVICRPRGREDVPFRSVARRMLEGLRGSAAVRLPVLRPQTFGRFAHVLREAQAAGEPYHLVHFDGHGVWSEHGYLEFENRILEGNRQLVGGSALGNLLAETGVAALVLNACQSAYADPRSQPVAVAPDNPHQETRAYGSLAQEVMDAGAAGVVAMRYNVFVDTAAQFMADLYERLAEGDALGEAASFARKQLHAQPLRGIAFDPRPLQDWMVPVVFEAEPVALFPRRKGGTGFSLSSGAGAELEGLPPRPDAGFIGRDEPLLALDRAFDDHAIVLLHAYAGSGKTTAAAEFARWYRETGGIDGPVLFTSFEHYRPLLSVVNDLGSAFDEVAQDWLALDETKRRGAALQLLRQRSVLWIWDNVEPVAGFPKGSESKWSAQEQRELADFLRAARETKAKFLLTSRREERDWLGDLPARIPVPRMPDPDRLAGVPDPVLRGHNVRVTKQSGGVRDEPDLGRVQRYLLERLAQRVEHGIDLRGVERHRGLQQRRANTAGGHQLGHLGDGGGWAGDHGLGRAVDGRDDDLAAAHRVEAGELIRAAEHRGHDALAWQGRNQLTAPLGQEGTVLGADDPGQGGGRVRTRAVPEHRPGDNAVLAPPCGQGEGERVERRLEVLGRLRVRGVLAEQDGERGLGDRAEDGGQGVQGLGDGRVAPVEAGERAPEPGAVAGRDHRDLGGAGSRVVADGQAGVRNAVG